MHFALVGWGLPSHKLALKTSAGECESSVGYMIDDMHDVVCTPFLSLQSQHDPTAAGETDYQRLSGCTLEYTFASSLEC